MHSPADPSDAGRGRICLVTMMRFPVQEAVMFVNYHLNIGVDRIFLYFDDPKDPAIDALSSYGRVVCVRCDDQFWRARRTKREARHTERQAVVASGGLESARSLGFDWIAHLDQDELLHCDGELKGALARVDLDVDVVRVPPLEALPLAQEYVSPFLEIRHFKTLRGHRSRRGRLLCRRAYVDGNYFHGHMVGKSLTRIGPAVASLGPHEPVSAPGVELRRADIHGLKLLHFDCMGLEPWREKWVLRMRLGADSCGMRPHRARQLERFSKAHRRGAPAIRRLFRRLYQVPRMQRFLLERMGMLQELRMDSRLFSPPSSNRGGRQP